MNPLGWKSAIYTLAKAGETGAPSMLQTADQLATAAAQRAVAGGALSTVDDFVLQLGTARNAFDDAIRSGVAGADDAAMATRFTDLASTLDGARQTAMSGAPAGHAHAAATAARDVSDALRAAGTTADGIPEQAHMGIWNVRSHLDQAWHELGMAKAMGQLGS